MYYHGTPSADSAKNIIEYGLKRPSLLTYLTNSSQYRGIYLSPNWNIALSHAMSVYDDSMLKSAIQRYGRYGWIFGVDESDVNDNFIKIDETFLAVFVKAASDILDDVVDRYPHHWVEFVKNNKKWTESLLMRFGSISPSLDQRRRGIKKIINSLTDDDVKKISTISPDIVVMNSIVPHKMWQVDRYSGKVTERSNVLVSNTSIGL